MIYEKHETESTTQYVEATNIHYLHIFVASEFIACSSICKANLRKQLVMIYAIERKNVRTGLP